MLKLYEKKPIKPIPQESWRLGPRTPGELVLLLFFGTVTAFCNSGIDFIGFIGTVTPFWTISLRDPILRSETPEALLLWLQLPHLVLCELMRLVTSTVSYLTLYEEPSPNQAFGSGMWSTLYPYIYIYVYIYYYIYLYIWRSVPNNIYTCTWTVHVLADSDIYVRPHHTSSPPAQAWGGMWWNRDMVFE